MKAGMDNSILNWEYMSMEKDTHSSKKLMVIPLRYQYQ